MGWHNLVPAHGVRTPQDRFVMLATYVQPAILIVHDALQIFSIAMIVTSVLLCSAAWCTRLPCGRAEERFFKLPRTKTSSARSDPMIPADLEALAA